MVFVGANLLAIVPLFYNHSDMNFGVVIFIGPIPMLIRAGPKPVWIILVAAILAVLTMVTLFLSS
jgi:uncharacterized membrane protein